MNTNLDENRRGDGPREAVEPAWTWEREQEYWERVGRGEIEPDWLAEKLLACSPHRRTKEAPAGPALWGSDDRLYANLRRPAEPDTSWTARLRAPLWFLAFIFCFAALVTWQVWPSHRRPGPSAGAAAAATAAPRTKSIDDVRVGERLAGRNPLREQVDGREPDPATWRRLSLRMRKADGRMLWIELLRPVEWIELYDAEVGQTIELDLYEMGAVGQAEVTHLRPCPPIQPGTGAVVTGTFKHAAGPDSGVVQLTLEGETEPTGVTDNHAYWSADRQDFVKVGRLRIGERVDTEFGERRVVSVVPIDYRGFLYNLETTEHVYRVGSLGTLVHNSCAQLDELAVWRAKIGTRRDKYTLVKLEIGGQSFFGRSFGKHLDEVYPFANVNRVSRLHAEGDAIGQALRARVRAKEASIFIDRHLCPYCGDQGGLRSMAAELGVDRLYVYEQLESGISMFRMDF